MAFLQVLWASILVLGWMKSIIAVLIIAILFRIHAILGLISLGLFIAYLAHWI